MNHHSFVRCCLVGPQQLVRANHFIHFALVHFDALVAAAAAAEQHETYDVV